MEIAAAAIAFVDFSIKITSAAAEYTQSVKNYPQTLDVFIRDLRLVAKNLQNLQKLIENNPNGAYDHLGKLDGPLNQCQEELGGLLMALQKRLVRRQSLFRWRANATAGVRRMFWPLSEKKIQGFQRVLERYSGQFNFAVNIDTNAAVTNLRSAVRDNKYSKVLRWLSAIEFRQKHDFTRQQRQHDTGTWLLQNAQYRRWADTESPGSVLWLNGIHGCGKSILMSMIIEDVIGSRESRPNDGGAFLYCTFDDRETTNGSAILRSILVQLLSARMDKAENMLKEFERRIDMGQGPPSYLEDLMDKIKQVSTFYGQTTIIIDALDECDIYTREQLISRLVKLPRDSKGRIKLLVSSRPEHDIRELLLSEPEEKYRYSIRSINLSEESEHLKLDAKEYIYGCFQTQRRLKKIKDPLRSEIISTLLDRETFFQLVRCQLDEISRCRTEDSIRQVLADLPKDLNDTYTRILKQIDRKEDIALATHTFLWLSTSKRVLKLEEVVESFAITPDSTCLPSKLAILRETELLEICGSLVTYDEATGFFSLSHFSVKEFFTCDWLAAHIDVSNFYIEALQAEKKLAASTLAYLAYENFRRDGLAKDFTQKAKLLEYAAGYWTDHAKMAILLCDSDNNIYDLTKRLLLDPGYEGNYRSFLRVRVHVEHLEQAQTMTHIIKEYNPNLCPVYYPVLCGLTTTVERFIELHPEWLDAPIGHYGTPLIIAAGQNDVDMIKCLLKLGADINKGCSTSLWNEIRPLFYAVYLGNFEATDVLIQQGGDIKLGCRYMDNHSKYGTPLLHPAAYWGNAEMISRLLAAGVNLRKDEESGTQALHWALQSASLDTVKILCENGCDPKFKGPSGKTALQQALELRNGEIIHYLVDKISDNSAAEALGNLKITELEWARSNTWYPRLAHLFQCSLVSGIRPATHSPSDVWELFSILTRSLRLPRELAVPILDMGEHWIKTEAKRDGKTVISQADPDKPYVSLQACGPVRRVSFRTKSHDQGFSGEPEHHGKYSGSHTWFEAGVLRPDFNHKTHSDSDLRRERKLIQRNVCADLSARYHFNEWTFTTPSTEMREWFANIRSGDTVGLYPRAQFPGWANHVEAGMMELWCALV